MIKLSILQLWAIISTTIIITTIIITGFVLLGDYCKKKRIQNTDRLKAIDTLERFEVENNKKLEKAIDLAIEVLKNEELGS